MTRFEFIENRLIMGIGLPWMSSNILAGCQKDESFFPLLKTDFSGKVIIVGAGAAGLAAGYLLERYGVDFEILEAAPIIGGRLKKVDDFADFPIDLGAEWIHTEPKILADILSDPEKEAEVDVLVYNPQTVASWNNGSLQSHNYIRYFYSEWKFKHTTWFDFFEQHIALGIKDHITCNSVVNKVDHAGDRVKLTTVEGTEYLADKVLFTNSIKTFQTEQINFLPALPQAKRDAFQQVFMGDGIKVFIEFKERFYPDIIAFGNILEALEEEEKFVYDAAFRKDSSRHILGLFAINEKAAAYTQLENEAAIIKAFLAELDEMFDGKASENYLKHIIQNWSQEQYIQGAYSYSFDGDQQEVVAAIAAPVDDKLFFAGEALSISNQAMVHGACQSAYETVTQMLGKA